jgi:hypothetical protein
LATSDWKHLRIYLEVSEVKFSRKGGIDRHFNGFSPQHLSVVHGKFQ